jgi:TetR/AcrR family transcriptional regulator, transcriptional repressor for nem operon
MIKVTKEQSAATRARILDEAARAFREHGFAGVSVADVMKSVGRTHGGFYGHFRSKEDLMAQACQHAVSTMLEEWSGMTERAAGTPLGAITTHYLSGAHRDEPGTGCLMAALGPDAARQPAPVRRATTESLRAVLDFLTRLTPGRSAAARREKAIVRFASLVGALVAARAVNDPELSDEILQTVSRSLAAR